MCVFKEQFTTNFLALQLGVWQHGGLNGGVFSSRSIIRSLYSGPSVASNSKVPARKLMCAFYIRNKTPQKLLLLRPKQPEQHQLCKEVFGDSIKRRVSYSCQPGFNCSQVKYLISVCFFQRLQTSNQNVRQYSKHYVLYLGQYSGLFKRKKDSLFQPSSSC